MQSTKKGNFIMRIQNLNSFDVLLEINGVEFKFKPNEFKEINSLDTIKITLKQHKASTSMSVEEIFAHESGPSGALDLVLSSYQPAFFDIVLQSEYVLAVHTNADIKICQQKIRPCYECSYDRLFLVGENFDIISETYCFPEKEEYTKNFKKANTKIHWYTPLLKIALIVWLCVSLLVSIFMSINYGILGTLASVLLCAIIAVPLAVMILMGNFSGSWHLKHALKQFESDTIVGYFHAID